MGSADACDSRQSRREISIPSSVLVPGRDPRLRLLRGWTSVVLSRAEQMQSRVRLRLQRLGLILHSRPRVYGLRDVPRAVSVRVREGR